MDETTHKAIQERAYFLWLQGGCQEGMEILHWLQAEAEAELGLNPVVDEMVLETDADVQS